MSTEYQEPRINWNNSKAPVGSDMNRIEGNAKANHEAILDEASIRLLADTTEAQTRLNADNAEYQARVNADTTEAQTRLNADNAETSARLLAMDNRVVGNGNGNIPRNDGNVNTNLKAQHIQYSNEVGANVSGTDYGVIGHGTYGLYGDGTFGAMGEGGVYGVWGRGPTGVKAEGTTDGVYATGPRGVYGFGDSVGVLGVGGAQGVSGAGGVWDFYASGSGGNYGPFTGSHEISLLGNIPEIGMILSCTGKVIKREDNISATIPECKISAIDNDNKVFGVFTALCDLPKDHWYKDKTNQFGLCNALGDGQVLVTNKNGKINAGDYITTSTIPGYGQKQEDDLVHSYTLGKCTETIDWDSVVEEIDGYKKALVACIYVSA